MSYGALTGNVFPRHHSGKSDCHFRDPAVALPLSPFLPLQLGDECYLPGDRPVERAPFGGLWKHLDRYTRRGADEGVTCLVVGDLMLERPNAIRLGYLLHRGQPVSVRDRRLLPEEREPPVGLVGRLEVYSGVDRLYDGGHVPHGGNDAEGAQT